MKTRLIGDIHGMVNDYKTFSIGNFEGPTIQVGDFGIGFGQSDYWNESVNEFHRDGTHRFIRGNHDNPKMCREEMVGWIPDGKVENDVMFIGGAWSIDHAWRTPNIDWWEDEQCSEKQFEHFLDVYSTVRPRVMITHDAPIHVSDAMFTRTGLAMGGQHAKQIPNITNNRLQEMFDMHQPELWVFGHWHNTTCAMIRGTTFVCIGELDYFDVDFDAENGIHDAVIERFA